MAPDVQGQHVGPDGPVVREAVPDPQGVPDVLAPEQARQALVVEDDEDIRDLLSTLLTVLGFEVREAHNGEVGLEMLRAGWRPDLIVLDLMMPVMNGWQVLEHVTSMDPQNRPAVILLTAGTEPRDFNPDIVVGSVRKPFDVELLYDTVVGCISVVAARQQMPGCPLAESEERPQDSKDQN